MPDSLQLGPFLLNGIVLTYILAAAAAYASIALRLRKEKFNSHPFQEIILNGMIITVLFWKFGLLLTQPVAVIQSPSLLIMASGSRLEVAIGMSVAVVYGMIRIRKIKLPWRLAADWTAYGLIGFLAIFHLLHIRYGLPTSVPWGISPKGVVGSYHPVGAYKALLLCLLWIWIWRRNLNSGTGQIAAISLIAVGVIQFAVSLLAPQGALFLFLSYEQWLNVGLIVLGYVWMQRGIIAKERSDVE